MKGYIYITDKVVVNPELKPDESDYTYTHSTGFHKKPILSVKYGRDLKKWEFNNIEVENVWKEYIINKLPNFIRWYSNWHWNPTNYIDNMIRINEAQPCTAKMSGTKAIVLTLK